MKKLWIFLGIIIVLSIISFFIFTDAKGLMMSNNEALRIGEEKYLEFLWMVDGAFNDSRYKESFIINGKETNYNKDFTCTYSKGNNKTCFSDNFEESFKNLFVSSIKYDDVYSDGVSFAWYEKTSNGYKFTNMNTCNVKRMSKEQKVKVIGVKNDELSFEIEYEKNESYILHKLFVLKFEDGKWKVSNAYYHDLCHMDYEIG